MTKSQTTSKKHSPENKPLNTSRYTGFYLTMLILSTIGTFLGLFGLIGIPETIRQFSLSPVYASISLFNVLIVLPVSMCALILLWFKRPLGIWLKLSAYAASIVSAIGMLLSADAVIKDAAKQALAEVAQSDQASSTSLIEGITTFAIYAGLSFAILVSIIFGLLWWFAWKNQSEADSE